MYATFDGNAWSPGTPMMKRSTSTAPALAVYGGKLYLAHKGAINDNRVWYASFDGVTWSADQIVAGVSTSAAPALAVFKGKMYLACKGVGDGTTIWYTAFDGAKWLASQIIPYGQTSAQPALATYNETLYLAYAGPRNDGTLWYQTYDGTSWCAQMGIPGVNTSAAPNLVTFNRKLLLAYWEQDAGLLQFAAKSDGEWQPVADAIDCFTGMTGSAGLAVFRNKLYCAANLGNTVGCLSRLSGPPQNVMGYVTSYTFGSVDDPLAISVEITDDVGNKTAGSIVGQTEASSTGFTVILTLALESGYQVALLDSSTGAGTFNGVQLFAPSSPIQDGSLSESVPGAVPLAPSPAG